jgi:hypothetical protein
MVGAGFDGLLRVAASLLAATRLEPIKIVAGPPIPAGLSANAHYTVRQLQLGRIEWGFTAAC